MSLLLEDRAWVTSAVVVVSVPIHVAVHVVVATTNRILVRDLGWTKVACSVMVNIMNIFIPPSWRRLWR